MEIFLVSKYMGSNKFTNSSLFAYTQFFVRFVCFVVGKIEGEGGTVGYLISFGSSMEKSTYGLLVKLNNLWRFQKKC